MQQLTITGDVIDDRPAPPPPPPAPPKPEPVQLDLACLALDTTGLTQTPGLFDDLER